MRTKGNLLNGYVALKQAQALMLEVGLIPLYENELPYIEILTWLRQKGFRTVYFSSVIRKKKLGESCQSSP